MENYQKERLYNGYEDLLCSLSRINGCSFKGSSTKDFVVYIDNKTIVSPKSKHHHEDVNCFLKRFRVANLKVNVDKYAFACDEVFILGLKVSKDK